MVQLVCLLFTCCESLIAETHHGKQVWRISPPSQQVLSIMRDIGEEFQLDFWKEPTAIGRPIDFLIQAGNIEKIEEALKKRGILDYEVYIPDVQALIEKQKYTRSKSHARAAAMDLSSFDYSNYHTAEEIYEWMDLVVSEYSSFTKKYQIGTTYEGRPMYVLEFKKPSTEPKPIMVVDSLIHCREWISTAALLFIFKEMLQNPEYAHMMDDVDWYFVPMINIDGYKETWNGDRLWRKTVSTGPSSICKGVDANRNWDSHWSEPGASGLSCSYTYYGPTPASESEVRHLANFVLGFGFGNISAYVTTHSYSQLILYPYGYAPVPAPNDAILNMTGRMMSEAMEAVHGMYYTWGPSATAIYVSSGTTDDWTYDKAGIELSYTFELRDTGRYGFLLPADQIIPNGEEYLVGLEVLKNYVVDTFVP